MIKPEDIKPVGGISTVVIVEESGTGSGPVGPPGPAGPPGDPGPQYRGEWAPGTTYHPDDLVTYGGTTYITIAPAPFVSQQPPPNPAAWQVFAAAGAVGPAGPTGPAGPLGDMAEGTVKGRAAGSGTGNPIDLSAAQQKALIEAALASGGAVALKATGANNNVTAEPAGIGAFQVKGTGTGAGAYALFECLDSTGTRIGMIYNEPTSQKMVFMNSRNGQLVFGTGGVDRFVVQASGGVYIGSSPSDPGAGALQVQNSITSNSGSIFCRGSSTNGFELFNGATRIGFFSNVFGAPRLTIGGDVWFAPSGSDASDVRLGRYGANGVQITDAAGTTRRDLRVRSVELNGALTLGALTVGTLPTASANTAARYEVTDASAPAVGATVAAGGTARVTVRSNGTNWIVTELH